MSLCIAPAADFAASDNILLSWSCTATGRLALALADTPPQSATTFTQGNPRGSINGTDRSAWGTATGLTFPSAVSSHDEAALWLLTGLADPAGIDAPLPLAPKGDGTHELWMGGQIAHAWSSVQPLARYSQAHAAVKSRQKAMQLRKIKAMAQQRGIEAIRKQVGKYASAKVRNYLGVPMGRRIALAKAQEWLDDLFRNSADADLRVIKSLVPQTEYTRDGSEGSGDWTEVTSGLTATTWDFNATPYIRATQSSSGTNQSTAQRFSTPFSVDDMTAYVVLANGTTPSWNIGPAVRMDSGTDLDCYNMRKDEDDDSCRLQEWNASSIGTATDVTSVTPAAGDIVGVSADGSTIIGWHIDVSAGTNGAVVTTDTTHQGVDHVYAGIGPVTTTAATQYSQITEWRAADIAATAAGGGGRRPRAFRVGA